MKICPIYYQPNFIPPSRKHHAIHQEILEGWLSSYKESGSSLKITLITDEKTSIPQSWPEPVERVKTPPPEKDILNTAGWLKSQAFEVAGPCVVIDLDAIVINCIDTICDTKAVLAMAPYPEKYRLNHWPYKKLNAGVLVVNESIYDDFKTTWEFHHEYKHITYYDELVFTDICLRRGELLDTKFNAFWDTQLEFENAKKNSHILHFSGLRKDQLHDLLISR